MAATTTDCVIIGAGHSGLAASYFLQKAGIGHIILERGEIANSWKTERWDSMRLLTPNRQARLPGFGYRGDDPDGFFTVAETVRFIEDYAAFIAAPVRSGIRVTSLCSGSKGFSVATTGGEFEASSVIVASGACNRPSIPECSQSLPESLASVHPLEYRNPEQLPPGGVLTVGASATGLQLALEIHLSGRPVTLSVGEHVRLPRIYRGQDILWWMEKAGILDERYDEMDDLVRARNIPSPQLIGTPQRRTMDLNALSDSGIRLRGKLMDIREGKALFSGSLKNHCELADLKMNRLLRTIDEWIASQGLDVQAGEPDRFPDTRIEESPPLTLDFGRENIRSVVWATGFAPDYTWLDLPVFDRKGRIRHDGGVADWPGLYVLGTTFLRRRKSSFIHGAEDDARDVCGHLVSYVRKRSVA
ncbi:MAG: pyridine nucleotide-disulfide oxidoreductase [Gammaproteobacteria bacterium]|nr:pyridine nucleotide-disulfide oxidoreductase [Gammaproteobacteria bacterium]MYD75015.1 pyridine nucleotide-disulfide oxidoreductase [Gammaproteobacteria bacterium]MYJ51954.1 pyridine nucleotide-disulfide oxidoreductase [Gammaproteobacteria bacterium]